MTTFAFYRAADGVCVLRNGKRFYAFNTRLNISFTDDGFYLGVNMSAPRSNSVGIMYNTIESINGVPVNIIAPNLKNDTDRENLKAAIEQLFSMIGTQMEKMGSGDAGVVVPVDSDTERDSAASGSTPKLIFNQITGDLYRYKPGTPLEIALFFKQTA
ncbi:hypothetical protein [Tellurirhabdus bombi]|uniref:hypothetical protein n=1 Tax=Tellurirhabdus bombi TaxID=2907205 RepID=UPI001F3EAB2A|nr:hypothetical protein [Tellurirhabdus bombi]